MSQTKQNNDDVKELRLNRSQAMIHLINANVTYATWPRAGGKTSGGIGPRVNHLSEVMPRSQCLLVADTFERIAKVLWPSIENFLNEEMGLRDGVDYIVHKKPPEHWTAPLYKPAKYDHVISFATGFALCEVSLEVSGSGNGYNAQSMIGDEVKYWDEKKFKSEVRPAIRGGKILYGHLAEYESKWFFSDKFPSKGADIGWVLKKREDVDERTVQVVYTYQLEVIRLQGLLQKAKSENRKRRIEKAINQFESRLREKRKNLVYYSDALPFENLDVLGQKYFDDLERDLSPEEFKIAIKNEDPDKSLRPFYSHLSEKNFHVLSGDHDIANSLIIATDYQFSISPICSAQYGCLPGSVYQTLNFIQSTHTLFPKTLTDAVLLFCEVMQDNIEKHVHYVYDHTAIGRSPHGKTFKDIVIEAFISQEWSVTEVPTGDAPDHDIKYEKINHHLAKEGDGAVRIHEHKNKFLKKSLEKATAITVNGRTKKDKSQEKEGSKTPPEEATHYSDVFDQIVWAVAELGIVSSGGVEEIDILGSR